MNAVTKSTLSRRGFLAAAAGTAVAATLAACTTGAAHKGGQIKFWDMPWGPTEYSKLGARITADYKPSGSNLSARYQTIQWANFIQTFAAGVASKTGPAVAAGGAFQAYQFDQQGMIAPADHLLDAWKKNGMYDDFLPGTIETFKTKNGYCAIPSQIDMRVWWYRKSVLDKVGVTPPTTWAELLTVGKELASAGHYAFGVGAGAGNNIGSQALVSLMINNGGGLFNKDNEIDVVTDRNIETMDFIREMVGAGIVDPGSVSYTLGNLDTQWKSGAFAMGINTPGLDEQEDEVGDLLVAPPMKGPHGDLGTLQYVNNVMMFKNTPSQASSEAFVTYWYKNYGELWKKSVFASALPVLKSVADLPEFKANKQKAEIIKTWQPIAKTYSTLGNTLKPVVASIDSGAAITNLTQTMLAGKTDSKTALTTFQNAITTAK
jgi:multiple sugar transport system substrate-binding protein